MIADCEASLKSLGTDYVDLYLIHWPDPETAFEETARALQDLLAAGKARYVGVSNYEARQLREACGMAPTGGEPSGLQTSSTGAGSTR